MWRNGEKNPDISKWITNNIKMQYKFKMYIYKWHIVMFPEGSNIHFGLIELLLNYYKIQKH